MVKKRNDKHIEIPREEEAKRVSPSDVVFPEPPPPATATIEKRPEPPKLQDVSEEEQKKKSSISSALRRVESKLDKGFGEVRLGLIIIFAIMLFATGLLWKGSDSFGEHAGTIVLAIIAVFAGRLVHIMPEVEKKMKEENQEETGKNIKKIVKEGMRSILKPPKR